MVLFESLGVVSYSHCIVTVALSCIISEIKPDISQIVIFLYPLAFGAPVRGVPVGISRLVWKTLEWWGYSMVKKIDMCNRLHTIPACDGRAHRQTDGQTDRHLATV